MKNIVAEIETTEETLICFEVSDEALEASGEPTREKANFTLGYCSALSVCDG